MATRHPTGLGGARVEDPCTELSGAPSTVLARTDRGDVVRLVASPCGYLLFDTWEFELPSFQVPLEVAELGA